MTYYNSAKVSRMVENVSVTDELLKNNFERVRDNFIKNKLSTQTKWEQYVRNSESLKCYFDSLSDII